MKILWAFTGGIACYKALSTISILKKAGNTVIPIGTPNSLNFLTTDTINVITGIKYRTDLFETPEEISHISLTRDTDLMVIGPATANIIGKIANGIADDLVSTAAMSVTCPIVIIPAMNGNMYRNEIFQQNLKKLNSLNNYYIVTPDTGYLACGDVDIGRYPIDEKIIDAICYLLYPKKLSGKKIIVSAGATSEKIDNIRYITNKSSGKMGIALAKLAYYLGAEVELLLSETVIEHHIPSDVNIVSFSSADDLRQKLNDIKQADMYISTAAVSDIGLKKSFNKKIKKENLISEMEFKINSDIVAEYKKSHQDVYVAAFSAETDNVIENSINKRDNKKVDCIIANDVSRQDIGFNSDCNEVNIIFSKNNIIKIDKGNKSDIAYLILKELSKKI